MVYVKGRTDIAIANVTELGLTDTPIRISPNFRHKPINLNAWGEAPGEVQFMLASVDVVISLINFDRSVLDVCLMEAMGGAPAIGNLTIAGTRLGNGKPMFAPGVGTIGNHYVQLSISSPTAGKPWNFISAYMSSMPMEMPLGTEKSVVTTRWTAIPYDTNYYNAGLSAYGLALWNHNAVA